MGFRVSGLSVGLGRLGTLLRTTIGFPSDNYWVSLSVVWDLGLGFRASGFSDVEGRVFPPGASLANSCSMLMKQPEQLE